MRRALGIGVVALILASGSAAKGPPSDLQLCGTNGCVTVGAPTSEQLFAFGGSPRVPARPAAFYRLRWGGEDGGYWLPDQGALWLGSWSTPDSGSVAILTASANGLEPFPPPAPTSATVGGRPVGDPASYVRLLGEGSRVATWVGALGWIPVRLWATEPSPWTGGGYDLRISKGSGFVWREGAVYRIPVALARLTRARGSLAPTPAPAGFARLGESACAPASPRNEDVAFGTATGTTLWARFALPDGASWADATDASLVGAVAKPVGIALRLGTIAMRPAALDPDGTRIQPGPAGYVFPEPGCWRIHAGDGIVAGDVWLAVAS